MSETPAERVISKLGGPSAVANIRGVHVTRVFDWRRKGRIPTSHQQPLLDWARAKGVDLGPADFFDLSSNTPEPSEAAA